MYFVQKRFEVAASHRLELNYESPCQRLHGHNWQITVHCKSEHLDENGMVVSFEKVKAIVHAKLDHRNLNEVLPFNPTAENIARWVVENVPYCYRADVKESENNQASYNVTGK